MFLYSGYDVPQDKSKVSHGSSKGESSSSVSRALEILSRFTEQRPELGLTEISREVGISKTSAARFLMALEQHAYVARDQVSRRYRPGVEMLRIGSLYMNSGRIRDSATPIIRRLADQTGFTSYLSHMREGARDSMVILLSFEGAGPIRYTVPVGERLPLHCSATGKAALSTLAPDDLKSILHQVGTPAETSSTVADQGELITQLGAIRAEGYSVNWEEYRVGVASVAAPAVDVDGNLLAVVSVGFATSQVTRQDCRALGLLVRNAAAELARNFSGAVS